MKSDILSEREEEILSEVVKLYLGRGEPVASGSVARSSPTGLSSASIRNVMSALEERGLLEQPHTSAGRVPSDAGLGYFIERFLPAASLTPGEKTRLRARLIPAGPLEERLARVTRVLADVSQQVGLAATQASPHAALQSIHFVRISSSQVLAVVVTRGGLVDSRMLAVERDFREDELERISNYCTRTFAGRSLAETRDTLERLMREERAQYDRLLRGVLELRDWARFFEPALGGGVYVQGVGALLESVDRRLEALQRLVAAFSDKSLLIRLLDEFIRGHGSRVVFGSQLDFSAGTDLGMIVSSFELADGESGVVGVIGLRSMDYPHLIPVVDYIGEYLAGADTERAQGGTV